MSNESFNSSFRPGVPNLGGSRGIKLVIFCINGGPGNAIWVSVCVKDELRRQHLGNTGLDPRFKIRLKTWIPISPIMKFFINPTTDRITVDVALSPKGSIGVDTRSKESFLREIVATSVVAALHPRSSLSLALQVF